MLLQLEGPPDHNIGEDEFARLFPDLEPLPVEDVPQFATDVWPVTTRELRHAPHVAPAWEMVEAAFTALQE